MKLLKFNECKIDNIKPKLLISNNQWLCKIQISFMIQEK